MEVTGNSAVTLSGNNNKNNQSPGFLTGTALLADNGGPTKTIALAYNSKAIDTGRNTKSLSTDQRGTGFDRDVKASAVTQKSYVDIGAFELQKWATVSSVTCYAQNPSHYTKTRRA